jgi:hypothetical protein
MRGGIRRVFWVEAGLATVTGLSALMTAIVPDWIEFVSGWDPDQGDGLAEWLIVSGLCFVTIMLIMAAKQEWRRTSAVAST